MPCLRFPCSIHTSLPTPVATAQHVHLSPCHTWNLETTSQKQDNRRNRKPMGSRCLPSPSLLWYHRAVPPCCPDVTKSFVVYARQRPLPRGLNFLGCCSCLPGNDEHSGQRRTQARGPARGTSAKISLLCFLGWGKKQTPVSSLGFKGPWCVFLTH